MGTRATYQFIGDGFAPTITYYIHNDGYPEGAADYLRRALCPEHATAGGLAESFLRENDRAEFTTSHDRHADTEYRYTVAIEWTEDPVASWRRTRRYILTATMRVIALGGQSTVWGKDIFHGDLNDFIAKHLKVDVE